MNKGTAKRLRRLEGQAGKTELWLSLGDEFAWNARSGVTMPEDVLDAQTPGRLHLHVQHRTRGA